MFLQYDFFGGKGNLQDSGNPAIAEKTWVTKLSAIAGFYCICIVY